VIKSDLLVDTGRDNDLLDVLNKRRRRFIQRFTESQQRKRPRQWVGLQEMADWCARGESGIGRDESRRKVAWGDLIAALSAGRFERSVNTTIRAGSRSKVLLLHPDTVSAEHRFRDPVRLSTERARNLLSEGIYHNREEFISDVLQYCWVPAEVCEAWFEAEEIQPKRDWFIAPSPVADPVSAPATSTQATKNQRRQGDAQAVSERRDLREAEPAEIREALRDVLREQPKPPNVNEAPPLVLEKLAHKELTATWEAIRHINDEVEFASQRPKQGKRPNQTGRIPPR
jgi:hypothetical protein